jgi:hypothetical protein
LHTKAKSQLALTEDTDDGKSVEIRFSVGFSMAIISLMIGNHFLWNHLIVSRVRYTKMEILFNVTLKSSVQQ